jgi:hypothetical protein
VEFAPYPRSSFLFLFYLHCFLLLLYCIAFYSCLWYTTPVFLVCFACFIGVFMSGFVSVVGSRRVAGVVARPLSCGWVWARRALPGGAGWSPAPACVFVPFASFALACAFARGVSVLGWRVWVRSGSVGSPVFAACGLPVPVWSVKFAVPVGWSLSSVRAALPAVPVLSSLAALGV